MQDAVKLYLKHSFLVVAKEQEQAAAMVPRLERATREALIGHYGEANAWRGLLSDDLQICFDLMKAFEAALADPDEAQCTHDPQVQNTP